MSHPGGGIHLRVHLILLELPIFELVDKNILLHVSQVLEKAKLSWLTDVVLQQRLDGTPALPMLLHPTLRIDYS